VNWKEDLMGTQAAEKSTDTVVLRVTGMTCGGCVGAVNRILSGVEGVAKVHVDLTGQCATVTGTATVQELIGAVESAGFGARLA
jgi:Au+-exporting ATPase